MANKTELQELTVDEAIERFAGEWIFMQVTADDEHHAPHKGIVVAHHPRRGIFQRHISKIIAQRRGDEQYYTFFGERRFKTWKEWEEWREALDAMNNRGS